ncbi:glycosyltransferase [Miltoncostaea marina]|uniref:glycosyltransferase n=1 Tax=Miltoncostaea marina TaxID=2843215 RepID=UPI001C3C6A5C|nr:glycosyltransferase [Miltoncostaea marina]
MAEPLRVRVEGAAPLFAPRARWVLETLAEGAGRPVAWTDGPADLVYAPARPDAGVWIPADPAAQAFFEGDRAFPGPSVHRARGLTLLFPPSHPDEPLPGDLVASAFYLLARWDELRVPERDRFGRLPLAASAFGRIAGLDLEDPPVEGYIAALRAALRIAPPTSWGVAITHDIDRIRRRTPKGLAGIARRRGPRGLAAALAGPDPWDNVPDLLEAAWRRGTSPTVFLIGRNAHPLDGTPRRTYERERAALAAAVRAAGGEVGLHGSFGASESGAALAAELAALRAEAGPVDGVRMHYLRFRYHETVRWLEAAGAAYDSSLGFSEAPGFAAGIARPFRPWLVGEERPARLTLLPLAVMDTTLHSRLGLDAGAARERALRVLERVRLAGGRAALLWHNTYLADDRAPGYGPLWGELLDELARRGAALGPAGAPSPPPGGARLDGRRVVHLTSVHRPRDVRIFHKEARAAARAGAAAWVGAPREPIPRARRLAAGWRLARAARARDADLYHVHDPELLPAALWLARAGGAPVVYDVHEYLGQTTRTKRWLPAPLRRPLALAAERAERAAARRLAGVVTANPDLAARFAAGGARAVSVSNSPWTDAFPEPAPMPADPVVLYVGGLGPLRGLEVMRAAFPLVSAPGARLVLAGPGDPGALPPGAEAIGRVDHSAVPGLLAACRVAWIPLQRHGNYDRAVPTKLVEAMAAGRPVVAADLGVMGAMVRAHRCGLTVPPDDPRAHAAALDRLLGDPAEAARMGAAGRAAFAGGLGFEAQARALTDLYAEVMRP